MIEHIQLKKYWGKASGMLSRFFTIGLIVLVTFKNLNAQDRSQDKAVPIKVSNELEIIKISEHSYIHCSYTQVPGYGRVGSNGFIYTSNGEALLFDTPMTDSLTGQLVAYINDSLNVRIVGFVPNHWHDDCLGGLATLTRLGIPSYANEKTIAIARTKNLPVPQQGFVDSLIVHVGDRDILCRYYGPAHSTDNIITWFPSEKILFGGCMVKELKAETLGNLVDADLHEWPKTIARVIADFPAAEIVIPGHGAFGGRELLTHTLELLTNKH
jgi:metallo-beta-lactamase class B